MARGRRLSRVRLKPLSPEAEAKYLQDWSANALRLNIQGFPQLSSRNLFGNDFPLEVEIGSGTGEFLVAMASENPGINYLGVEVSHRRSLYAVALAAEAGLANILFLRANFRLLRDLIPEGGWGKVYLHFPDPVHKRKDEKRNVFGIGFLEAVAWGLEIGGKLSVASDNPSVFFPLLEQIEGDLHFEKTHSDRYLEGMGELPKSRFQRMWEHKGVVPLRVLAARKPIGQK